MVGNIVPVIRLPELSIHGVVRLDVQLSDLAIEEYVAQAVVGKIVASVLCPPTWHVLMLVTGQCDEVAIAE